MNQLVTVDHTRSQSLVPQTLGEAVNLAEFLSRSKLIPAGIQGSPADIFIVLEQARRWNIDFFALVQEVSIVRGRPMYSGKLTAALVNSRGGLSKRLAYAYKGAGDNRTITVSGTLQGENDPRVIEVRLGDAKTNNEQWVKQPDQMLMYHGARVWARRHTPELMLGIYGEEEFDEAPTPVRRQRDAITGELVQAAQAPTITPHDSDGVVLDDGIPGFLDRRDSAAGPSPASPAADNPAPSPSPHEESGAGDDMGPDPKDTFIASCLDKIRRHNNYKELGVWWNSEEQKKARRDFELNPSEVKGLTDVVTSRLKALTKETTA